ncbi:transforming acidic coiled-coil-containing protein 3-like isoform X2 [Lineus longissimus]|uniref:transforming acidic coiled-coil-containing protein 3-like isoform X2 n=1 Tax=Lineus longissimus TaxID=88925 RepID=UPI002B4E8ADC
MNKENENVFKAPLEVENRQTVKPILKNSTRSNLIAFSPEQKHLKVTFQTPSKTKKVSPGRYDLIRVLDEDENWIERTSVLTRQDHTDYFVYAKQILDDLVWSLPVTGNFEVLTNPLDNSVFVPPGENLLSEEELPVSVHPSTPFEDAKTEFKLDEQYLEKSSPVVPISEETLPLCDSPITPLEASELQNQHTVGPSPVVALSEEKLLLCDSPITPLEASELQTQHTAGPSPVVALSEEKLLSCDKPVIPSKASPNTNLLGAKSESVTMDGDENQIPITKGAYNLDFLDSMDLENVDPFATKTKIKMGFSPPKTIAEPMEIEEPMDTEENPFQSSSKMRNSPPPVAQEEENPFQTKTKMCNSPPPLVSKDEENPFQTKSKVPNSPPSSKANLDIDDANPKKFTLTPTGSDDEVDVTDPLMDLRRVSSVSPAHSTTDINDNDSDKTPFQTATDDSSDIAPEPSKPSSKKKTGSAKKVAPRKSKFARPAFTKNNDNDGADIVIFEPKKNPQPQDASEEVQIFEPKSRVSTERESGNDSENPSAPTSHTSSRSGSNQREIPSSEDEFGSSAQPSLPGLDSGLDPLVLADQKEGETEGPTDGRDDFGFDDDGFRPATEVFNDSRAWDMLEKFGSNQDEDKDSLLSRQSLYVKFDPLVKSRGAGVESVKPAQKPAVNPAVTNVASSEVNDDLLLMNTPPPSKAISRLSKHPASRVLEQSQAKDKEYRDVDKLFTCSPEQPTDSGCAEGASPTRQEPIGSASNDGLVEVLKYSEYEWIELKKQLDMDFQARLLAKERDFDREKKKLNSEVKELKAANEKLKTSFTDMQKIVTEYEKTISQVISDKEHVEKNSQTSMTDLVRERNQAVEDLQSMESAFADLLRRNNKLKEAVESFKKNEETLKKCVTDYQAKVKKHEQRYATLKQHAEDKLQSANEEMEKITKTKNSEIARLQAAAKRSELAVTSLETSLEQKIKENKELTAICDDLIKQVGGDS